MCALLSVSAVLLAGLALTAATCTTPEKPAPRNGPPDTVTVTPPPGHAVIRLEFVDGKMIGAREEDTWTAANIIALVATLIALAAVILSIIVAVLSTHYNKRIMRQTARSTHAELAVEIDKELIAKPTLWGIYDEHEEFRRTTTDERVSRETDAEKSGSRQAFIYLHLNVFELVFNFHSELKKMEKWWLWKSGPDEMDRREEEVWDRYMEDLVVYSPEARAVIRRPDFVKMYSQEFRDRLSKWMPPDRPGISGTGAERESEMS